MFKNFASPDYSVENKSRSDFNKVYKNGSDPLNLFQQAGSPQGVIVRGTNFSQFVLARFVGRIDGTKGDLVVFQLGSYDDLTCQVINGTDMGNYGLMGGVLMSDVKLVPNTVQLTDETYSWDYVYVQLSGLFDFVNFEDPIVPNAGLGVSITIPGQAVAAGTGATISINNLIALQEPVTRGFSPTTIFYTNI